MSRATSTLLLVSGLLLLFGGLLLHDTVPILAQDDEDEREYVGISECNDCHRDLSDIHELTPHGMTLLEVEEDAEADELGFIKGDFTAGEDIRTVTFPDESERAFDQGDIAFTLGAGRNYQVYVTQIGDAYSVLPAKWDVNAGAWMPFELAESWPDEAYNFGTQCAGCHTVGLTVDAEDNSYEWEEDGVQCEACHGPGSLHIDLVDDAGFEFTGDVYLEFANALENPTDARVCGSCHIRGQADDGIHPYPIDYKPGDDLTASFTPVSVDDETYWHPGGYAAQPNMQYNEWALSGHASSLNTVLDNSAGVTGCLMCHSNVFISGQIALIEAGITDYAAFETVPLLVSLFEDSGLSPTNQRKFVVWWLPLVMTAMEADNTPDTPLEDVVMPLLNVIDFDEDDYDPEAPVLTQIMPMLAEYYADVLEDAEDGDTEDLDELTALIEQLMPFLIDDIEAQRVSVAEAIGEDMAAQSDHFGVTCSACHVPHPDVEIDEDDETLELPVMPSTISTYDMCTACHQNTTLTETLHHPVKEMFEGDAIIEGVEGMPSTHFKETDGPRCTTCHMSEVLVGDGNVRANHNWTPVLPSGDPGAVPDACSNCHTDLSLGDLRSLIEDTQSAVQSRLSLAWGRVASIEIPEEGTDTFELYNRAVTALQFVQNDGSGGVHNYAYTDALLDEAGDLLSQVSVPRVDLEPTEAPAPTATPSPDEAVTLHAVLPATTGVRPITFIVAIGAGLTLLAGAWLIYRRTQRNSDERET